ncbi:hypothetical protein AGMMS49546_20980 [Spirochaetia bacterium]|nr:hypothetical protein AGMMS49546_20980 [Spirochaetia bacterium]
MTYSPNFFMEALRALLVIAGWYVLFYIRHRPASKLRRVVLLISFPVCYTVWRLLSMSNAMGNEIRWAIILILFALICGDWKESLFTAIYYIGMEACMDTFRNFIIRHYFGGLLPRYSPGYNVEFVLLYLMVFGWTFFYYWVLKNRRGNLPLRFWIMMIVPPLGSTTMLTHFAETLNPLQLTMGINIYWEGALLGLFFLALNLLIFYMYIRLIAYYEIELQTQVLQGQLTAYARRITTIETFHRQAGEMRHELKNLLFPLKIDIEQQNYESANRRIWDLLGDLKQAEPEFYTGISLIDAVISYKASQIRELGAGFDVQADLLDTEALGAPPAYDIASIMGISLDNAADAVAAITASAATAPASLQAAVHCTIQRQKNMLLIRLTNPLPGPLQYENGEIRSTKAESGHGLGLSALRRIVQKYAGDVTISDSGGVFCLSVMLFCL